jgi:LacI family transcriptional regulator
MTVSNVINGHYRLMSATTRKRVDATIKKLNYRPHTSAQSLRLSQRLAVGMLIVDESPTFLTDPFTTHLVAGLSRRLSEQGYALVLEGMRACEFTKAQVMRSVRSDGLCLMLSGTPAVRRAIMNEVADLDQPIVVFQEHLSIRFPDTAVVRQDDRLGARMLAELLLSAGARRIVYLIPQLDWPALEERARGIREACRHLRGNIAPRIVRCGKGDYSDTQVALEKAIKIHGVPDAVMAGNDQMGIAAMKFLEGRGLEVPKQVRVTGFNAFEFYRYTDPVLTTVRSDAYRMGVDGAKLLLDRLELGKFSRKEIVMQVVLERGGST